MTMSDFDNFVMMLMQPTIDRLSQYRHTEYQTKVALRAARRRAECVYLRAVYDMSFKEIAEELGMTPKSASNLYRMSVGRLRKESVREMLTK